MRLFSVLWPIAALAVAVAPGAAADRLPSGNDAAAEPELEPWLDWVPANAGTSLIEPLDRDVRISSPFGPRHAFGPAHPFHAGVDFAARFGTPVHATADGWVIRSGTYGSYGNLVEVAHGNGLVTRYAHLSRILVASGRHVEQGQEIGLSGSTGRSTGAHLHYEVRQDGQGIDPWTFPGSHDFEPQRQATFAGPVPRWDAWIAETSDRLPMVALPPEPDQAGTAPSSSRAASKAR